MSKPLNYDAPRRSVLDLDEDQPEDLRIGGTSARSASLDVDDAVAAENFELPGADLSDEELTVPVVPMRTDEFRCGRCFLVHHRSQRAGEDICKECA
ncbi:DUF4193 domain-containing protein [Planosporangium flavigriseum]|uniref:DUF4193 domain-containing protein n=1 Tax=Planosporangium flavigriseum TaxID=373681 RepID=A0A8J3LTX2_9ACTN|nr:DUF4193 domain-containing protein [Planosporangium flavigriseum]NJC65716.1 DUF4193 domain-containing protein [Planosporangium flavigriseum]GIG73566.1 hypothetical protein Pfl04_19700 [Planosporangium flavigriseum]